MDSTRDLPPPAEVDEFDALDDLALRPLDNLSAFDKVDRTVTLDIKMDNLGDGAN